MLPGFEPWPGPGKCSTSETCVFPCLGWSICNPEKVSSQRSLAQPVLNGLDMNSVLPSAVHFSPLTLILSCNLKACAFPSKNALALVGFRNAFLCM